MGLSPGQPVDHAPTFRAHGERYTRTSRPLHGRSALGEGHRGARIEVNFNYEFSLDAMRLFDGHEISLKFSNSANQGIESMSDAGARQLRLRCIIMPMIV